MIVIYGSKNNNNNYYTFIFQIILNNIFQKFEPLINSYKIDMVFGKILIFVLNKQIFIF